jgi:2,3-bisphosphoglycerate-independent phosphoglycerate mutase
MEYDGDLHVPKNYLVAPPKIDDTVGERMAHAKKRVLSISETQKFGHVTYFFNGNKSAPLPYEDQIELPSYNVPFEQLPEMSAREVTESVCTAIQNGKYDLIRLNLANGDMVGHSGSFSATVQAVEFLDKCIEKLYRNCIETNTLLLITADHGNADEMFQYNAKKRCYKTQNNKRIPSTSHSKNPVPFLFIDPLNQWKLRHDNGALAGGIAQIGATLLNLTGLEAPEHYLPSLVQKND